MIKHWIFQFNPENKEHEYTLENLKEKVDEGEESWGCKQHSNKVSKGDTAYILKKDRNYYIEASHIKPKKDKGTEMPDNILILCPNHHKEFDLGDRNIIDKTKEKIIFELNSRKYEVSLELNSINIIMML